jgi:hypothetical protein
MQAEFTTLHVAAACLHLQLAPLCRQRLHANVLYTLVLAVALLLSQAYGYAACAVLPASSASTARCCRCKHSVQAHWLLPWYTGLSADERLTFTL